MSNAWIVRRPNAAFGPLRLYAFAHAGGSGTAFLSWQDAFSPDIEIRAIQLPGRGIRLADALCTSMDSLSREIAQAVALDTNFDPSVKFAFLGHSLGGLLAFEVAHELRRLHAYQPTRLFLSGCSAPRERRLRRPLHRLDDAHFLEALQRYHGMSPELLQDAELMKLALPSLRADFQLVFDYRYIERRRLDIPLAVLAGRRDDIAKPENMLDWAAETTESCSVHWFDGAHFFIQDQQSQVQATVIAQMRGP